jgi:hypothetical protein
VSLKLAGLTQLAWPLVFVPLILHGILLYILQYYNQMMYFRKLKEIEKILEETKKEKDSDDT